MKSIKKNAAAIGVVIAILAWLALEYIYYGWELYGYKLINYEQNDVHFINNNSRIVPSTVVEYDWHFGYLVGLRLHVDYLECKDNDYVWYAIKMSNNRHYFVLDVRNDQIYDYISVSEFDAKLSVLGLKDKVSLNYSKFDIVKSRDSRFRKNMDYSNCIVLKHP